MSEFLQLSRDSLVLLGHSVNEIYIKRHELIKPDLNGQFRQLWNSHNPVTKLFFGDDLSKSVKEISETNKVGVKVLSKQTAHYSKHQRRSNFSYRQHSRNQKSFLWKPQGLGKRPSLDPKMNGETRTTTLVAVKPQDHQITCVTLIVNVVYHLLLVDWQIVCLYGNL